MGAIFVLSVVCIILVCTHCKVMKNCEAEFNRCRNDNKMSSSIYHKKLAGFVRSKHHHSDDMIPRNRHEFMSRFKCCFRNLSVCLKKEKKKKKDVNLQNCSKSMMTCAMGRLSLPEFRKASPKILRGMFKKYGLCLVQRCINECVEEYYSDMEGMLGLDCLNKYIHCAYSSTPQNRHLCHAYWKDCMEPRCFATPANVIFQTRLIRGIWACKKEKWSGEKKDKHVIETLRCILNLQSKGIAIPHLLTKEHVREGCFLVYGHHNPTIKPNYESCVTNNPQMFG